MVREIKLTPEELKHLMELHRTAHATPVISFYSMGPTWADSAWDKVRDFMNELGKKYEYNPRTARVNPVSGVVIIE